MNAPRGGWGEVVPSSPPIPAVLVLGRLAYALEPGPDAPPPHLGPCGSGLAPPASAAAAFPASDLATTVVGAVGEDMLGMALTSQLEEAGVDVSAVSKHPDLPTSLLVCGVATARYPGAGEELDPLELAPALEPLLPSTTHLHLDLASLAVERVRQLAASLRSGLPHGASVSVEVSPEAISTWSRYDAQACLRSLLGDRSLVAFAGPSAPALFPEFWTPDAVAEGAHDLGAAAVLVHQGDRLLLSESGQREERQDQDEFPTQLAKALARLLAGGALVPPPGG